MVALIDASDSVLVVIATQPLFLEKLERPATIVF